jgi:hypothetical protein
MAIDQHLAAVHFRIQMAGEAAEHTIDEANNGRPLAARGAIQRVIDNLNHVVAYLTVAGTYPQLLSYVVERISFYKAQANRLRIVNLKEIKSVGEDIYNAQGLLLGADPYLGIFSEQYRISPAGTAAPLQGTPALQADKTISG